MYLQTSFCHDRISWKIVDTFECARMTEHPVIFLGDLNFNYIPNEALYTNPNHYIETAYDVHQSTDQPTRVADKTSSVLDVILMSHPVLHRNSAVLRYTLSDHYLIYTDMEFGSTKLSVAGHNTLKFRDVKNFDMASVSNDLISCDILNDSQDNDDISWERWKLAYTDICDKHAPMKSLRLKEKRSNDPWYDKAYVWTRPCTRQCYTKQLFKIMARSP